MQKFFFFFKKVSEDQISLACREQHFASRSVKNVNTPIWQQEDLYANNETWWWLQGLQRWEFYAVDVKVISCYNISAGGQINPSVHKYQKDM